jgi:hypothetical protein
VKHNVISKLENSDLGLGFSAAEKGIANILSILFLISSDVK